MGMGFAIVLAKDYADDVLDILEKKSEAKPKIVGHVERGKGVKIPSLNLVFV